MTRYAVLSDIHANFTALQAVVSDASSEDLPFWVLGDVVGYGPAREAIDCLAWLHYRSQVENRWIPGNHDAWIVKQEDENGFGKDAVVSLCSQRLWFDRPECQGDWKWFEYEVCEALSPVIDPDSGLKVDEKRSLVVEYFSHEHSHQLALVFTHAAVAPDGRRRTYLYPWYKDALGWELERAANKAQAEKLCLLYGHTHFPAYISRQPDGGLRFHSITYGQPMPLAPGQTAVCPGSLGQPRDGDLRAVYLVVDTDAATVEFRRVAYDLESVVRKLRAEQADRRHQDRLKERLQECLPLPYAEGDGERKTIYHTYPELIDAVYHRLIARLRGDGGSQQQEYGRLYRRPKFDLESYDDWQANHREW